MDNPIEKKCVHCGETREQHQTDGLCLGPSLDGFRMSVYEENPHPFSSVSMKRISGLDLRTTLNDWWPLDRLVLQADLESLEAMLREKLGLPPNPLPEPTPEQRETLRRQANDE